MYCIVVYCYLVLLVLVFLVFNWFNISLFYSFNTGMVSPHNQHIKVKPKSETVPDVSPIRGN